MKFEYKRYRVEHGPSIERPVIPILIHNPLAPPDYSIRTISCEALVDSGSDYCIFPSEIGELIGIDVTAGERQLVSGVVAGESRPIFFHAVEISVERGHRFGAWAAFMPDLSQSGHGILGQHSFFSRLSFVKFQAHKSMLELGRVLR